MPLKHPAMRRTIPEIKLIERGWVPAPSLVDAPPLHLITADLLHRLRDVLRAVAKDPGARALVIGSTGRRAFSAGSDMLRELAGLGADASDRKILLEDLVLRILASIEIPTIAALNGPALGGGLELALACDLRVARAGVMIGAPEAGIGGLAATGSQRLTKIVRRQGRSSCYSRPSPSTRSSPFTGGW